MQPGITRFASGPLRDGDCCAGAYAVSFALPLERRRARTLRPFLVDIRLRNPCSFERCRFFGWYVRSIITPPCNLVKYRVAPERGAAG